MQHEARAHLDRHGRSFDRLLVHHHWYPGSFTAPDDVADDLDVLWIGVIIRNAQRRRHVVGPDEDSIDTTDAEYGIQVLYSGLRFDSDDHECVLVSSLQISPRRVAWQYVITNCAPQVSPFQRVPLCRRDDGFDFFDGFAVGHENPCASCIQRHRDPLGFWNRYAHDGRDVDLSQHGAQLLNFRAIA